MINKKLGDKITDDLLQSSLKILDKYTQDFEGLSEREMVQTLSYSMSVFNVSMMPIIFSSCESINVNSRILLCNSILDTIKEHVAEKIKDIASKKYDTASLQ